MASLGVILCVGAVTFIIIGVPVAYAMISAGALSESATDGVFTEAASPTTSPAVS